MSSVAGDTSDEIQTILDERWRRMTPADKAEVVAVLFSDCTTLAIAGIALQHGATDAETTAYHLAARRYGSDLANEAYDR